ncbi:hypothetical protein Tco_0941961 [Tanacetum coccineum]|uniref:Reverse transcriptase Ty1/copia-type domain-containing protein n=1 Tax=Tanacetum coccineum TaxID=301880 RepID=A0ABQ5DSC2_9ASTR
MEDGIFFNQSKYIKEMLKKFGLEDSKPTKTSMSTEIKLTKDDEADSMDSSKYQGMIGSLLYLTASRPDIMFSIINLRVALIAINARRLPLALLVFSLADLE